MERYCYVFFVIHQYVVEQDRDGGPIHETKEIGVYSTRKLARDAVRRFMPLPGFVDYPNGFVILRERCYLRDLTDKKDLRTVYLPYFEKYLAEEDCDFVTRGAFFESSLDAEDVIQSWKSEPQSAGHEEGFAVVEYTLNQDLRLWNEGFTKGDA